MKIENISDDILSLLCSVDGVDIMLESLGVDSLVDVDISLMEEQTTFWLHFKELEAFKAKHGNVCVPQTYASNQPLANWVMHIRASKVDKDKKRTSGRALSDRREESLNSIGFVWSVYDAAWEEKFNELVEYKSKHGHTNVPDRAGKLGCWVSSQRTYLGKKRKMTKNSNIEKMNRRIDKLDKLGFVWKIKG